MKRICQAVLTAALVLALGGMAAGQGNPCNPCGGKKSGSAMNPCNPCGMKGTHFMVNDPMGRNSATFTSAAPLEDIVGTTRDISGYIVFDPAHPKKGAHGELTIPVKSLKTGIPMRDEHLQGKDWLDAGKYPEIVLTIVKTENMKEIKSTSEFQTYDVMLIGDLAIHGKTIPVRIPGRFTFMKESEKTKQAMPGDMLAARASFDVSLDDFDISGPGGSGLIGTKVGESIAISISFRASNATAGMTANPCNPCGGKNAMNPCNPCGGKKAENPCNPCGSKNTENVASSEGSK